MTSRSGRDKRNLREKPAPYVEKEIDLPRDAELGENPAVRETLSDLYSDIVDQMDSHADRSDWVMDNWDMYNCKMSFKQFYNGTNQIYVPLVRDAIEARKTRFTNQLFPRSGRFADVISSDATRPSALMSLLDYYVRKCKLKTDIVPALIKSGDIEGQYSIYVGWTKEQRTAVWKTDKEGPIPGLTIQEIKEAKIIEQYPTVEVIPDKDIVIMPVVADSLSGALEQGGCVVILRRWTKTKIKQLIEDKEIDAERGKTLLASLGESVDSPRLKDPAKQFLEVAGIKKDGRKAYALIYEIWTKLLIDDEKRLCRAYMSGQDQVLSCRRNPYWHDRLPVLSVPKDKVSHAIKGRAPVDAVRDFQVAANDAVNMGMDSAQYGLCPIIMTDPDKNPQSNLILTMGSVWYTSPKDTQFAEFPQLWKDALEIVQAARAQVFQTLGVNPSMITQQLTLKKKLNQAEIAQEQQVDVLNTADAVSVLEEGILTPMLQLFIELDHQFRDEDITVPAFGEMGVEARMERIPPISMDKRYQFIWYGVEAARNAQQIQQQIAGINVLRTIPPQLYQGYKLNLVPAITNLVENAFGPRLAPLIFEDIRKQLNQDPHKENEWLAQGIDVSIHAMDNHMEHMQVHMEAMQGGDQSGMIGVHLMKHRMAIMQQVQGQMDPQSQQQGGQPQGKQGGYGGQAGSPKPGAQPAQIRGGQNPPGAIHMDQMVGTQMPRRAR